MMMLVMKMRQLKYLQTAKGTTQMVMATTPPPAPTTTITTIPVPRKGERAKAVRARKSSWTDSSVSLPP